ncbi:MAG TPA: lipopolysaccharide biosynthesis protein, partial [Acidimicrobiia bacterium]|nr:lipopolysaccharide biosynthesis protein [Acidimicrobiia bacterium]
MNEPHDARSDSIRSRLPTRFGWSAVSNYALAAVGMLVALITTPILTRHLGPEQFGIWILVGSTITYVQLLNLGFGGAVVFAIAGVSARDDDDALERTINSSFFLLLALGLVALVAALLAAVFLPIVLHLDGSLAATTRALLLLLGLDVAVSIPMDTFGCGLVALQRYDLLNASLIAVTITQAVAWTLVLVAGGGLLALGIVTVAISLVGQAARYVLLRRLVPGLSLSPARVDRTLVRSLAKPARWYALGDTIESFRDYTSVLVLGVVSNAATAGIFAVGDKLASLGTSVGTPLSGPLFPHAAALAGRGDTDALGPAARTAGRLLTGVTIPCCLVAAVLARPALVAWVGPTYERATPAVVILAIAFGLRSLGTAAVKITSGSGGQRLIAL